MAVVRVAPLLHLLLEVSLVSRALIVHVRGGVCVAHNSLQSSQEDFTIVIYLDPTSVAAILIWMSSRSPSSLGVPFVLDIVERILPHKIVSRDPLWTL